MENGSKCNLNSSLVSTLGSGINVGSGISVGVGRLGKNNEHSVWNNSRGGKKNEAYS